MTISLILGCPVLLLLGSLYVLSWRVAVLKPFQGILLFVFVAVLDFVAQVGLFGLLFAMGETGKMLWYSPLLHGLYQFFFLPAGNILSGFLRSESFFFAWALNACFFSFFVLLVRWRLLRK